METLLLVIVVGIITGWLMSALTNGSLSGMAANIVVAVSGAFFGNWLINQQAWISLDSGLFQTIVVSAAGALMLITLMRTLRLLA